MAKRVAGQHPGANVGNMIKELLVDAVVGVRTGMLPAELAEKWKHNTAFFEGAEQEWAPLFQEVFADFLNDDTLPPGLKAMFAEGADPGHQTGFFIQVLAFIGMALAMIPAFGQVYVRGAVYELNQKTANVPLSPADAADAVMRGVLDDGSGAEQAAMAGVPTGTFETMVSLIGEPPGVMDMVALWRRGAISEGALEQGIRYSRIHDTYIPMVEQMAYTTMSPADAIELAIKGVVPPDAAQALFVAGGGLGEQFDELYQAAGDAIGNEQVLGLLNQGLATQADVDATFGRSRMNPIFYPLAMELRHKFLQPFQIAELLKANPSLADQATAWMTGLGFNAEQIAAFVATNIKGAVATTHTETETMITQLFTDQVITEDVAMSQLANLGYDVGSSTMILELAQAKQALSQRTTAVSAIRSALLARKIDTTQASGDLDQLGIPPAARDQWLAAWNVELTTKVAELTAVQLGEIAQAGVMDYTTLIARYVAMGYSQDDADLLAGYYGGGPLVPATTTTATTT